MTLDRLHEQIVESAKSPLDQARALPSAAYTDPEHYAWEAEHVLRNEWLCAGHVSQVPNSGDFRNLDLLGEPLLLARGRDGEVRVLSRVCPHRGMDINPPEYGRPTAGNARVLRCPYHFWTFGLDGKCTGAPEMQESQLFCRDETRLHQFRTEIWHGFVFVNLSGTAEPLAKLYDRMGEQIAPWRIGDLEMVAEVEWDCAFNWKILVENFAECYHHIGAHSKIFEPLFPGKTCWSEDEHPGYTVAHLPLIQPLADEVRAQTSSLKQFVDIDTVPIDKRTDWYVYVGFPTFLLFAAPDRVYWYRVMPEGPERMKLLTTLLVLPEAKQMPDWEKRFAEDMEMLRAFHLEDMEMCTAVQRGMHSLAYKPGPLSHLEKPLWLIQRYLARRIEASGGPRPDRKPVPLRAAS